MTLPLGMRLLLRSFLLFLRRLVSFFRKRWDRSTRGLWYIFVFLRSRFSFQHPKKRDEIRRSIQSRPANPPTTVICASRLPPQTTPIAGGDTPVITSPTSISSRVRQPTVLNHEDTLYETHGDHSTGHQGANDYFLEEGRQVSRSPNSTGDYSRPPSQYSHRQSHYVGHRPPSQYSQRPSSECSYRSPLHLDNAEAVIHTSPSPRLSSPAHSRPPSITGSVTSQAYRAPGSTIRVRRPSPMRNMSQRRGRSSTPASARQSVHEVPLEVPPLPRSVPRASVSNHTDPHGTAVSSGPIQNPEGRLRPMVGIDRYEKHRQVVVETVIHTHIFPPVTTEFVQ